MTIRFGLIGFGAWGRFHARALVNAPATELLAVADPLRTNLAAARTELPGIALTIIGIFILVLG